MDIRVHTVSITNKQYVNKVKNIGNNFIFVWKTKKNWKRKNGFQKIYLFVNEYIIRYWQVSYWVYYYILCTHCKRTAYLLNKNTSIRVPTNCFWIDSSFCTVAYNVNLIQYHENNTINTHNCVTIWLHPRRFLDYLLLVNLLWHRPFAEISLNTLIQLYVRVSRKCFPLYHIYCQHNYLQW